MDDDCKGGHCSGVMIGYLQCAISWARGLHHSSYDIVICIWGIIGLQLPLAAGLLAGREAAGEVQCKRGHSATGGGLQNRLELKFGLHISHVQSKPPYLRTQKSSRCRPSWIDSLRIPTKRMRVQGCEMSLLVKVIEIDVCYSSGM